MALSEIQKVDLSEIQQVVLEVAKDGDISEDEVTKIADTFSHLTSEKTRTEKAKAIATAFNNDGFFSKKDDLSKLWGSTKTEMLTLNPFIFQARGEYLAKFQNPAALKQWAEKIEFFTSDHQESFPNSIELATKIISDESSPAELRERAFFSLYNYYIDTPNPEGIVQKFIDIWENKSRPPEERALAWGILEFSIHRLLKPGDQGSGNGESRIQKFNFGGREITRTYLQMEVDDEAKKILLHNKIVAYLLDIKNENQLARHLKSQPKTIIYVGANFFCPPCIPMKAFLIGLALRNKDKVERGEIVFLSFPADRIESKNALKWLTDTKPPALAPAPRASYWEKNTRRILIDSNFGNLSKLARDAGLYKR